MKTDRPVNLNLFSMSWPLAALASITHRITGVVLFVGVGFALYALDMALASPAGYAEAVALARTPFGMLVFWGLLLALTYHILAGVKHLLLDFHFGDSLQAAQIGAIVVIIATIVVTGIVGASLW